jgi:ABC-type phosphate transport system substrate-binding protein
VAEWAASYAEVHGLDPFEIVTLPFEATVSAAEAGKVEVVVAGMNPPEGWFATPLKLEGIAVVVNPNNQLRSYSLEDLNALFSGRITSWKTLGGQALSVHPVIPLKSDELRISFEARVLEGLLPSKSALLAPSSQAMISLVTEDPSAIGYLPFSQISEEVRAVRVDGAMLSETTLQDGRYPLVIEILALAPQEPAGVVRDWLVWLQTSGAIETP